MSDEEFDYEGEKIPKDKKKKYDYDNEDEDENNDQ